MSALLEIVPRLWAVAGDGNGVLTGAGLAGPVAAAAYAVETRRTERFQPGARKGPHTLQLVQNAEPVTPVRKAPARLRLVEATAGRAETPAEAPVRQVHAGHEFYRKYTEAMLRRYTRLSMEAGRVPSLLGQEMFRGRVTSYRVHGFDDVVIFVHDMKASLSRLSPAQQHLLRRIACEQYTQGETAAMLGISLRTVIRRYQEAVDRLTAILLERRMLEPQVW